MMVGQSLQSTYSTKMIKLQNCKAKMNGNRNRQWMNREVPVTVRMVFGLVFLINETTTRDRIALLMRFHRFTGSFILSK